MTTGNSPSQKIEQLQRAASVFYQTQQNILVGETVGVSCVHLLDVYIDATESAFEASLRTHKVKVSYLVRTVAYADKAAIHKWSIEFTS